MKVKFYKEKPSMKNVRIFLLVVSSFVVAGLYVSGNSGEIEKEDCIFLSSLHFTARGMAYWYDKDNGGIETVSGIPYSELGCKNCHVASCDICHKTTSDNKVSYSTKVAKNQELCLKCHGREASIMKIDRSANQLDVHFANEMQCMDCHSAREMHGDGAEYNSMKQIGALDTKCEKCHDSVSEIEAHTIHGDKLDCKACHERHVLSCTNCHFQTLVDKGKRVAIPMSGWTFLMNYNGKVTSANTQTFVVESNKTFLMFAPQHTHSIMKEGRNCKDCHSTEVVKQVQKGKLNLTWFEGDKVENLKGTIPVVEGVDYDFVYQNYQDEKWLPIKNPTAPKIHYAGFGSPLSREQLQKLAEPQAEK